MVKDLWKPDIEVNPNLDQRVICADQQNIVDLKGQEGGCFGIACGDCILTGENVTQFYEWIRSNPHGQHDLFG